MRRRALGLDQDIGGLAVADGDIGVGNGDLDAEGARLFVG
jgi:hypothetical protein